MFTEFMDYLFGIISFVIRAPFVGWANIIENIVDWTISDVQKIKIQNITYQDGIALGSGADSIETIEEYRTVNSTYKPAANDKLGNDSSLKNTNNSKDNDPLQNRVNIETIIYNRLPLLDVNVFDVNLQDSQKRFGWTDEQLQDAQNSPVHLLRKNIAIWYFSIRNISIVVMLIILVYLGIKLAIATTGEKKAQCKELLKAWVMGFIAIFLIHYFMIIVIEVNSILVQTMEDALTGIVSQYGHESLYDTIRTRAYSLKLSEGVPATIMYFILIYFLIRFLFIYIKRYFSVCILTLTGPLMGAKFAFDKIQKGRTTSLSNWMFDYALNVLLQSVHALIYLIYMTTAFKLAATSIPGFVLALVMINFIFKAEDYFLKIFKFDDRASTIRDVRENKNYFLEAYKVSAGIGYFARAIPMFGIGFVKNTTKLLGTEVLMGAQLVTSTVNRGVWAARNINARANDEASVPYTPIDVAERLRSARDQISAGITGRMDDALYKITGVRSLRLGLGRLKLSDPDQYSKIKKLMAKNKKLKREALKRRVGGDVKSIKTMAKLMAGIPMLVVSPGSGFTMLATSVDDLRSMVRKPRHYGHENEIDIREKPRTITGKSGKVKIKRGKILVKGRRGRVVKLLAFGAPGMMLNNSIRTSKRFKVDKKQIRKNEQILGELRRAQVLKNTLSSEVLLYEALMQINLEEASEEEINIFQSKYEEALGQTMTMSLDSILVGKNIEGTIKEYMKRNNLTKLDSSDIKNILKELNLENIENQIASLTVKDLGMVNKLQNKIKDLEEQIASMGENIASNNAEIRQMRKEIKESEDKIVTLTDKIDSIKEVGKRVSNSGNLSDYMINKSKLEQMVIDYLRVNEKEKLEEDDIDKIVTRFEAEISADKHKKELKTDKKLNRREAASAILDNGLEDEMDLTERLKAQTEEKKDGKQGNSEGTEKKEEPKFGNMPDEMFTQLETISELVRELETLEQKNKVTFGNSAPSIQAKHFTKEIQSRIKKKKKDKK